MFAMACLAKDAFSQCQLPAAASSPSVLRSLPPRQLFPIETEQDGFIDRSGKVVHKPVHLPEDLGSQPLVPFVADDHRACGFKDKAGVEKVKPQFRGMRPFKNHMAGVQDLHGNWGFVKESGEVAVAPSYDFVADFSEGLVAVSAANSSQCQYIEAKGKEAVPGTFHTCGDFTEGIARVEVTNDHWAFIDRTGKVLAKLTGDERFAYVSEGLIPADSPDGKHMGFVNTKGEFVVEPKFTDIQTFSEGLAAASDESGKVGYIDKSGKFVIEPRFCDVENGGQGRFQEGFAYACDAKSHLFGFINREGRFAIAPQFVNAPCTDSYAHCGFNGGLAFVETSKRRGYINTKGQWVWSVAKGTPLWAKP